MAKATISIPSQSYTPNTRTVTLPNLTTDDNGISATLTRESWPDTGGDILTIQFQGSDDGTNFYDLARFTYAGGDQINSHTGQPVTFIKPTVEWPARNGVPQRPSKARAIITNTVTITTAITLTGY